MGKTEVMSATKTRYSGHDGNFGNVLRLSGPRTQ